MVAANRCSANIKQAKPDTEIDYAIEFYRPKKVG